MSKRVKIIILVAAIIGVLCIGGGVLYSRNSVSQQSAKSNNEENISGSEEAENSSGASSGALISSGIENPSGLENNSGAENPSGIKSENEINRDLQNKEKELKTAKEKTEKQLEAKKAAEQAAKAAADKKAAEEQAAAQKAAEEQAAAQKAAEEQAAAQKAAEEQAAAEQAAQEQAAVQAAQASTFDASASKAQILSGVNQQRGANGLGGLSEDGALDSIADTRAKELVQSFSHTRPQGGDASSDVFATGATAFGENIAAGQSDGNDAMNSWMNSSGHRENILSSDFTKIGIGVYYDPNSTWKTYYVQVFSN